MSWNPQQPQNPQQPYPQQQWPQQQYPPQYPQQPQWGPPPPPPRRGRGLLIALIGGLVVLLVAGAGVVWLTTRGNDDPPQTHPSPSTSVTATTPTAEPSASHAGQLNKVTSALAGVAFKCYDSLTATVTVVRCFAEPQAPGGDQLVTMQVVDDQVTWVHVKSAGSHKGTAQWQKLYRTAVDTVAGALLPAADAAVLHSSTATSPTITWGTAQQGLHDYGWELQLTMKGKKRDYQLTGQTRVTVPQVLKAAQRQHLSCKELQVHGVFDCVGTRGTEVYSMMANSTCGTANENKAFCAGVGANALWVWGYVAFGKTVTRDVYNRIKAHLVLVADLAYGKPDPEVDDWIGTNLDGKRHTADVSGLQISIQPGESGGIAHIGENPNVVAITIQGITPY
ncbi:hypothetical protein AB0E69_00275 [Kribbella sp. NPDC026611]|uniref:hypothetical protein n=1 Tax=Kribbella sp. NPDC026611 TaxID=3154911 RepID=UPI0033F56B29